ncbi:hypothetical protein ABPG74_022935 [Tetrahymena malaccensis]
MASAQTSILEFNANLYIQDLVDTYNECDLPFFNQNEELDEHKFFITLNQMALEYVAKDHQSFSMHLIDHYCNKYSKKQIIAKSCYSFYYCWKKILKSSSDARLYAFCCFNKLIPSKLIKFYCKIRKQIHSLVTDKQQVLIPTINSIEINLEQVLSLIKKMFQKSQDVQKVNQNLTNFLQKNKVVYTPKEKIKACLIAEFIIDQYIQVTLSYEQNCPSQEDKFNGNKNQFQQENIHEEFYDHQQPNNNNTIDQIFQNGNIKNCHSSSNLQSQGHGYMQIHNLKQSKSQSQILPQRNRSLGGSSKSPLRQLSNSQNRMSQNNRNQIPNIIITSEEQQNENILLQSDQNFQKTIPIKRKSEQNQIQDNSITIDESSKKPQILFEIENNNLKSEIENFQNQVTKLQDENQFCQLFNQKLEQIFLEILEISIESDYRSSDVDKIIEKYEEIKKQQGDQGSLLEFRENISQMKELAQLKTNTLQQNSLFSSQENFNANNIRKISHNNSSQAEYLQPFSASCGNENQNNTLDSPLATKSQQKKRSLMHEEVSNQSNSNNNLFTEEEQQQRQHLALLEEVSQSLSQQINKNNLKTLEKIIKQDQHQQQAVQSPQQLSISFTNLNSQQLPQSNSPLTQNSLVQLKDMLLSSKNKRNSLSPVIFQQSISFKEEGEQELSKNHSENHNEYLNIMDSLQLNNEAENLSCKQQGLQNQIIQKQLSQQSMPSQQQVQKNQQTDLSISQIPLSNLMNEKSKQVQQDQTQLLNQSNQYQQLVINSKKPSLKSPQINFTNSSNNNSNIQDKQNLLQLQQQPQLDISQNQQYSFQQQPQQTFQLQQPTNLTEFPNNKTILDQLNQKQQQKLLELQQIQQLIQSQQPKEIQQSQNYQIPQIFGQTNDKVQQQKKQEISHQQNQTNQTFQYQQKQPFKLNQTLESDIRTFDPSMSIPSSIASSHQQNQQALHRQHYQNLLQRQQEKQDQENNQKLKQINQSSFSRKNSDRNYEYDHHSNPADDSWSIKTFDPDNIPQVNLALIKNNQHSYGHQVGYNNQNSQNKKNMSLIQFNNQKIHSNYKMNKLSENMPFLNGIKESIEEGYDKKSISFRDTPKSSQCQQRASQSNLKNTFYIY